MVPSEQGIVSNRSQATFTHWWEQAIGQKEAGRPYNSMGGTGAGGDSISKPQVESFNIKGRGAEMFALFCSDHSARYEHLGSPPFSPILIIQSQAGWLLVTGVAECVIPIGIHSSP